MNAKTFLLLAVIVVLAVLVLGRSCRDEDQKAAETKIGVRYLACTNCGAQYEIPADYFVKVDPSDMEKGIGTAAFRCRECGEIAAQPGMVVEMNGKVVSVVGHVYDKERGIDETQ